MSNNFISYSAFVPFTMATTVFLSFGSLVGQNRVKLIIG